MKYHVAFCDELRNVHRRITSIMSSRSFLESEEIAYVSYVAQTVYG